jgi:hypothetical protein
MLIALYEQNLVWATSAYITFVMDCTHAQLNWLRSFR